MKIFANKKVKRFIIILMVVVLTVNIIPPDPIIPEAQAGIGGILMAPLTALTGGIAFAFQQILNGAAFITSASLSGDPQVDGNDVFISDIVYNQLSIIKANIFDTNDPSPNPFFETRTDDEGTKMGINGIVKQWYAITRLMAIAATLVILVYVAIKIILASTGKDKAKYTELLKDWLLSLLLIFTLHYVMAAILFCSDAIVQFFVGLTEGSNNMFNYKELQNDVFAFDDFSIIYALVWIALLIYTLIYLVLYIKRLILICFFVVISPLIVILSTINKLRGKGSGVLDYWLKQFIANVVMQPIDALLFTIVGSSIVICMENGQPLMALVFVIALLPMRSWITQFFDQKADQNTQEGARSTLGKIAGGAAMVGAVGAAGSAKLAGAVSNFKPKFKTSNVASLGGGGGAGGAMAGGVSGANPNASLAGGGATTGVGPNKITSKQLSAKMQADKNAAMHAGHEDENAGGNAIEGAKFDMQNPPNTAEPSSYGKKDVAKATGRALVAGAGKAFGLASKAAGLAGAGTIAALEIAAGKDANSIRKGFSQNYGNISQTTQNTGAIGGMAIAGAAKVGAKGVVTAGKGAITAGKLIFTEDGHKELKSKVEAGKEVLKSKAKDTVEDVAYNVTHPLETAKNVVVTAKNVAGNAYESFADKIMNSQYGKPEEYAAKQETNAWVADNQDRGFHYIEKMGKLDEYNGYIDNGMPKEEAIKVTLLNILKENTTENDMKAYRNYFGDDKAIAARLEEMVPKKKNSSK